MAVTKSRKSGTTRPSKPRATKVRFNGDYEDGDWNKIPSKGALFSLAIAAFNGADFPGAEYLRSRSETKELLEELAEKGFIDKRK